MAQKVLDVRKYSPTVRHSLILEEFERLKPGEGMYIINDHEPVHLLHFLSHRDDFDINAYHAKEEEEGKWIAFLKKKEVQGEARAIVTNFDSNKKLSETSFTPIQIFRTNTYAVILAYFKPGQFIPVHKPSIDVILLIRKGKGVVVAGDNKYNVKEGDLVIVPRGVKRGVLAETEMEILHIVSPPPNERDHEEVEEGLRKGKFEG
ncbi:DUF2249 domain-containing protein [Sulfolobus acidocaldarius]|uniref:DUF2249 domain-containing protein n=3 Tax=Sulfolobus acidocaldarius TaxID=2285 RepID=Q4J769_SULAC|nr:DUF2249 domain-containing protein [Sulfolobus acidocaldarius]AAY81362.1 hypothetical protein Saci_2068 [Sulfolobus acidocaldarius DSM 639]AGE74277.1 hypothetical protein SacRon12I_10305 [Sulfolobus acidocaldarius Ron12/I]ALU29840.1 hypothetical protein ATY89_07740 [Sulfolobus acidocaldarius]ALU32579.1 hypothetical protein ATZ20_10760 [Sulfolobus acidocaldarius]WCM35864.1 DUF2249 domain-containing protein [Sulfolobus acidocaldarius DSM 639]